MKKGDQKDILSKGTYLKPQNKQQSYDSQPGCLDFKVCALTN